MILPLKPLPFVYCALFTHKFAPALLSAVDPLSFIHRAIRPQERANSVELAILPVAVVLGIEFGNVGSFSVVLTFAPVAFIYTSIREL